MSTAAITFISVTRVLLLLLATIPLSLSLSLAAAPPLTRIMQDPDWIGPPVEAAWWQLDGSGYHYRVKRADAIIRDTYLMALDGAVSLAEPAAMAASDAPDPVINRQGTLALSARGGNLYLRDLQSGELTRLFSSGVPVKAPAFSADGDSAQFSSGDRWWRVSFDGSAALPLAELRFERAPHEAGDDTLKEDQLRLFATLERQRAREEQRHNALVSDADTAVPLGAPPWYLGEDYLSTASALSADGRWMLLVVQRSAGGNEGDAGSHGEPDHMPRYVTRSGYVEIEDVRSLVGRDAPEPQTLWLLDMQQRQKYALNLDSLSGRDKDPLAGLKTQQDIEPHNAENLRPIRIAAMLWHPRDASALLQVFSLDNKDRWIVRVEAQDITGEERAVEELHRLTDPAWVNGFAFNEFGWVPDSDTAWLLSEESGYSHLYTVNARGRDTQHTEGDFEVHGVQFQRDGRSALLLSNRAHPTEYDLYRLSVESGELTRLSSVKGAESYASHPTTGDVLLRYSGSYLPTQAAVLRAGSDSLSAATDTRTDAYRSLEWQAPEFVAVPSTHGAGKPIWSKLYRASGRFEGPRPAVLFVHGAGYTQNTHHQFPYYFREQMFHNLLTERGYHVLDMDYRASQGYGRDWRTAIYRHMGQPELEDLIDGVRWLVKEHNADPDRVGVYGGSYGGFMTLMAMFKAPEVFAAGASLRPVTDWRHYNHGYTSDILNTPQVDPEAHRRSSPIEFVENLEGDLLISHGMLDDNVFYKDSVRLVQRLIELEKENWELASYPLEPHGFVHPESWLDQYRRILRRFETRIGDSTASAE